MGRDSIDMRLLGDWQRDLPLVPRPFAVLAAHLETGEADVINRLKGLCQSGAVSRVGGVARPNVIGASTLAAMAATDLQVEEIAAVIGEEPGVNHSYLRENKLNLWFVATGPDRDHVKQTLARISKRTAQRVFDFRLERSYHIDLGFPLDGRGAKYCGAIDAPTRCATFEPRQGDAPLIQALTHGLPLAPEPFRLIAEGLGRSETSVIARLAQLRAAEVIMRVGVIVRHRALGWRSNAMVVWDVSPDGIDRAGTALAAIPGINLCYRRTRFEGDWPYNLYCLVHAKARGDALKIITQASEAARLTECPRQILFSSRCFKQTGAMLTVPKEAA